MPPVPAPMQATVVSIDVRPGDEVHAGQQLLVLESMKMEHVVAAEFAGVVGTVSVAVGQTVVPGDALLTLDAREGGAAVARATDAAVALDHVRPDLAEVVERHDIGLDHRRPDAVERRRATARRTARENVADLVDDGSFVEYAPLVLAGQRRRRALQELIERTPADGLVGGIGTVDGRSIVAMSYDYTVLAGTQGMWNHEKKDRLFELAGAPAAPGRVLHRGRRRPSGRHRRRDGRRARHARVPPLRAAQRPGAARRHHDRLLLRRERGAARLL